MSQQTTGSSGLYRNDAHEQDQRDALTNGAIPVAVYGLGKMGLPLAAVYAETTQNTIGVDIDASVVSTVNDGRCHVQGEPGLADLVSTVVDQGYLQADRDPADAAMKAAIHVIIVPTLLDEESQPDLSMVDAVVDDIARGLSPGDLVVVESTVPPRTTVDRLVPRLRAESGLERGDFGAAACPERTLSGRALRDIRRGHPKIVGGIDRESTRVAALLYDEITDNEIIEAESATVAESVKVFEGVYRDVNIGLANQLSLYADSLDIDVNTAIELANTQPYCDIHRPGPGVGGHCIPVYPYFLIREFEVDASLLENAREVNDRMPNLTVSLTKRILEESETEIDSADVLLMGLTYRANVDEHRNSPAQPIAESLNDSVGTVSCVDPVLSDWSGFEDVQRLSLSTAQSRSFDAVLLLCSHEEFAEYDWSGDDAPVLDARNALDQRAVDGPIYTIGGRWP